MAQLSLDRFYWVALLILVALVVLCIVANLPEGVGSVECRAGAGARSVGLTAEQRRAAKQSAQTETRVKIVVGEIADILVAKNHEVVETSESGERVYRFSGRDHQTISRQLVRVKTLAEVFGHRYLSKTTGFNTETIQKELSDLSRHLASLRSLSRRGDRSIAAASRGSRSSNRSRRANKRD